MYYYRWGFCLGLISEKSSSIFWNLNYRIGSRDGDGGQFSGYGQEQVSGYSNDENKNDVVAVILNRWHHLKNKSQFFLKMGIGFNQKH